MSRITNSFFGGETQTVESPNGQVRDIAQNFFGGLSNDRYKVTPIASPDLMNFIVNINPTTYAAIGGTLSLAVSVAQNQGDVAYQWYRNGVAIANQAVPILTTEEFADGDQFYATATDERNVTIKSVVTTVKAYTMLSVGTQPAATATAAAGATVTIGPVAGANGIAPYTYQWYKNNVAIVNSTSQTDTLVTDVLAASDDGAIFNAAVKDSVGNSVMTNNCVVTVTAAS